MTDDPADAHVLRIRIAHDESVDPETWENVKAAIGAAIAHVMIAHGLTASFDIDDPAD